MEHEHTSRNQSPFSDEALSLPHFDEEVTLQSARPVVPLHEVKVAARSRRRLLLGAALLVAAIFGAVTASLIFNHRAQPQEASATLALADSSQAESESFVSASGEVTGSSLNPKESAAPVNDSTGVNATTGRAAETSRNSVSVRKQTPLSSRIRKQPDKVVSPPVVQDRDNQIPADEMEMRREQRREARRFRRERRVNGRPTGDGLTRIREIFEGSPRP